MSIKKDVLFRDKKNKGPRCVSGGGPTMIYDEFVTYNYDYKRMYMPDTPDN